MKPVHLFGRHTFKAAINNHPDAISAVFLSSALDSEQIRELTAGLSVPVHSFTPDNIPAGITSKHVHQGVIFRIDPTRVLTDFDSFIDDVDTAKNPAVAVLGELTDPHNVGAIIRSAAAFGISAILLPKHRQAGLTKTVARSSAGTALEIPLVQIGNVNTTLQQLKDNDFWVYGLAGESQHDIAGEDFPHPVAFVIGSEERGIREKTREHCDKLVSISISDRVESLNASVAAAVSFYEWRKS